MMLLVVNTGDSLLPPGCITRALRERRELSECFGGAVKFITAVLNKKFIMPFKRAQLFRDGERIWSARL